MDLALPLAVRQGGVMDIPEWIDGRCPCQGGKRCGERFERDYLASKASIAKLRGILTGVGANI